MSKSILAVALMAGSLFAQTKRANTFELSPAEGWAEIEWVSASTFRYARTWSAAPRSAKPVSEALDVKVEDLGTRVRFKTRYLTVDADKNGSRVEVRSGEGPLADISFGRAGAAVSVESAGAPAERFYGLGSRSTASLNLRGSVVETRRPFLISSAGYGEYFRTPAAYKFDLASSQDGVKRVLIPGDRVEYFFYNGPSPKEILEEHYAATGENGDFGSKDLVVRKPKAAPEVKASWRDLRNAVYSLQHESMSAMLVPAFNLAAYQLAGGVLSERASQLAAFLPVVGAAEGGDAYRRMVKLRTRLVPYMLAYGYETRTRGIPLIHPLAMQFPRDAEAWKHTDEFMVGDELLVAPVLDPAESVRVYFPPGIWTDLRTNEVYKGRQEVTVRTVPGELPMFSRNGCILPLAPESAGGTMELHYFPSLAAEFFLFEEDLGDITQVHAAPATEFMRLESESLKDRTYDWVIHHSRSCKKVELGSKEFAKVADRARLAPGTWFFDKESGNLHVRVRSAAGGDEIVNISF